MVYDFQRMKMMTVKKVPKSPTVYAKERAKLRELEMTLEDDEGAYHDHLSRPEISIDEAAVIAQFVTTIDMKYELGVQALWLLLRARDEGAVVEDAILYAKERILKEVKSAKNKNTGRIKKS